MSKFKHFEDLWIEAEKVATKYQEVTNEPIREYPKEKGSFLAYCLDHESTTRVADDISDVLIGLAWISQKYNINVWKALEEKVKELKIETLELEDEDEFNTEHVVSQEELSQRLAKVCKALDCSEEEAYAKLERGDLEGTLAEVELEMIRHLGR